MSQHVGKNAYLIKCVEKIRDQRAALTWVTKGFHETELVKVADESICCLVAESKRVTPKVPLEGNNRRRSHAHPDHGQRRLPASQAGVEES